MSLKHEDHPCKECREKFPSFSKLLNHIAKHHGEDKDNDKIQDYQGIHREEILKKEKSNKDTVFVFSAK